MPQNRCTIDLKWVFRNKIGGWFRACLVAQEYTQIKGVDFTKNYSPVVTDITLYTKLIMWLINKWDSHNIDVDIEFLCAIIEE